MEKFPTAGEKAFSTHRKSSLCQMGVLWPREFFPTVSKNLQKLYASHLCMTVVHFWLLVVLITTLWNSTINWQRKRTEADLITLSKVNLSFSKPRNLKQMESYTRKKRGHHSCQEGKKLTKLLWNKLHSCMSIKPNENRWWLLLLHQLLSCFLSFLLHSMSTFFSSCLALNILFHFHCLNFRLPPRTPGERPLLLPGEAFLHHSSSLASTLRSLLSLPNDWPAFSFSICLSFMENMIVALGSLLYVLL